MGIEKNYEGLQENIRELELPDVETWENKYPEKEFTVSTLTREFTCICPRTGLPDFASIEVEYMPSKKCLELKSFKEYLFSYRNIGIFHEHAVNRILEDLVKACSPRYMKVRGEFNVRGGIKTSVEAEYRR